MLEQLTVATPGLSSDHVAMSEYFWLQWIVITVYDIMSAYKAEGSCCDSMVNYLAQDTSILQSHPPCPLICQVFQTVFRYPLIILGGEISSDSSDLPKNPT